jgi:hypothetical protein
MLASSGIIIQSSLNPEEAQVHGRPSRQDAAAAAAAAYRPSPDDSILPKSLEYFRLLQHRPDTHSVHFRAFSGQTLPSFPLTPRGDPTARRLEATRTARRHTGPKQATCCQSGIRSGPSQTVVRIAAPDDEGRRSVSNISSCFAWPGLRSLRGPACS